LLMFGKGLPIRDRFDNLRMDYIDKSHLIGEQRYSDRLTYDGRWENNLYNFVRMVLPKLTIDLPRPFQMEGMIRKDDTLQHKAVREAVTNMVIHSDLMINGILKVEKYDDRIVLTNPGLLKLPIEQIYQGGESKARNQRIQNMFRMIGYGENLGSGFPLIVNAWNEKHWIKPELVEQPELMQVKLTLYLEHEPKDEPKIEPKDEPKIGPKILTQRQVEIITLLEKNDSITLKGIEEKLNLSRSTVKREISLLKGMAILMREGGNYAGHWVVKWP
ncbi:MAG: ATP-binding protein, partial [Alloprevotella sp.]